VSGRWATEGHCPPSLLENTVEHPGSGGVHLKSDDRVSQSCSGPQYWMCLWVLSDPTTEERTRQQRSLSALQSFLDAQEGPVEMLPAWMGHEGRSADKLTLSPDEAAAFRFDRAWDKPCRITILARS